MRKDDGHTEGMVSATPLSLTHRCICTPGGLFCQLVFTSVGMKNTQEIKAECKGQEAGEERDKQGWEMGCIVSERLRIWPQ